MATNAVRLAGTVLRHARRAANAQSNTTAQQLLMHLLKPLAFQILAKVRGSATSRENPLQTDESRPSACSSSNIVLVWQANRAEGVKAAAWELFTDLFRPASDGAAGWLVPAVTAEQMSGLCFLTSSHMSSYVHCPACPETRLWQKSAASSRYQAGNRKPLSCAAPTGPWDPSRGPLQQLEPMPASLVEAALHHTLAALMQAVLRCVRGAIDMGSTPSPVVRRWRCIHPDCASCVLLRVRSGVHMAATHSTASSSPLESSAGAGSVNEMSDAPISTV